MMAWRLKKGPNIELFMMVEVRVLISLAVKVKQQSVEFQRNETDVTDDQTSSSLSHQRNTYISARVRHLYSGMMDSGKSRRCGNGSVIIII